jgi:hypothetical protein
MIARLQVSAGRQAPRVRMVQARNGQRRRHPASDGCSRAIEQPLDRIRVGNISAPAASDAETDTAPDRRAPADGRGSPYPMTRVGRNPCPDSSHGRAKASVKGSADDPTPAMQTAATRIGVPDKYCKQRISDRRFLKAPMNPR